MENLPFGLAPPLHILPWWLFILLWVLLFIILALLLWRYPGRIRDMVRRRFSVKNLPGRPGEKHSGIIPLIESIREENLRGKTFRKGLFELSEVMKSHMERISGLHVEEMTSGEITRFIRIREPGKFFREMDLLVFREKHPEKTEYIRMFEMARNLAKMRIKQGDAHGDL